MVGGSKHIIKDLSQHFHSLQKRAFVSEGTRAPTGGNILNMQLWNPAASGEVLVLQMLKWYAVTAAPKYFNLRYHNAACPDGVLDMGNKHLGEAAGSGITRYSSGGALGTAIARLYNLGSTIGQQWDEITFRQGIFIPEGMGLILASEDADVPISVRWQWYEIDA